MSTARLIRCEPTIDGTATWLRWTCSDRDGFLAVVAAIKMRVPHAARTYVAATKSWRVGRSYLSRLTDVLPELATHARPPWSPTPLMDPATAEALDELYLVPGCPRELVQVCYRALSKRAHPDAGGTNEQQRRLNAAYEVVCRWFAQHEEAA